MYCLFRCRRADTVKIEVGTVLAVGKHQFLASLSGMSLGKQHSIHCRKPLMLCCVVCLLFCYSFLSHVAQTSLKFNLLPGITLNSDPPALPPGTLPLLQAAGANFY
jgi:hypothetical protein